MALCHCHSIPSSRKQEMRSVFFFSKCKRKLAFGRSPLYSLGMSIDSLAHADSLELAAMFHDAICFEEMMTPEQLDEYEREIASKTANNL